MRVYIPHLTVSNPKDSNEVDFKTLAVFAHEDDAYKAMGNVAEQYRRKGYDVSESMAICEVHETMPECYTETGLRHHPAFVTWEHMRCWAIRSKIRTLQKRLQLNEEVGL